MRLNHYAFFMVAKIQANQLDFVLLITPILIFQPKAKIGILYIIKSQSENLKFNPLLYTISYCNIVKLAVKADLFVHFWIKA